MNKYNILCEFQQKIKNTNDIDDILKLYDKYKSQLDNDNDIQILNGMLDDIHDERHINISEFMDIISVMMESDENDFICLYNETIQRITDIAQINTLNRIKKIKCITDTNKYYNYSKKKSKFCPHCGLKNYATTDTIYTVCGYSKKGFDWIGCGKDWCFSCGKKLCKSWDIDQLFNMQNRYHDNKCCKHFAHKVGESYNNYCKCSNMFVNRKNKN